MGTLIANIDDCEAARHARTGQLCQDGFEVAEAASGEEGLRLVATRGPAVALVDVRLADLGGVEVCRRIKAARPATAVLMITATDKDAATQIAAYEAGADGYLMEPAGPNVLPAIVRALLRARQISGELQAEVVPRREAEHYLDLAVQATGMCPWAYSPVTGQFEASAQTKAIFGLSPDAPLEDEPGMMECVHPDDRELLRQCRMRALNVDEPCSIEFRILLPDGAVRWASSWCRRAQSAPDAPPRLFGMIQDITQRRLREEQLRAGRERLELALDVARLGTWEIDLPSGRVTVSPSTLDMFGFDAPETEVARWIAGIHPDDRQRVQDALAASLRDHSEFETEYRTMHPSGPRWVHSRARILLDRIGRPVRVLGIVQDITARRESEELLSVRAAELAAVMDAMPALVFTSHDPECRRITGSRMSYEMLGMPPGSNISKSGPQNEQPPRFCTLRNGREIAPEDLPMQIAARTGRPVRDYEFDIALESGACLHLLGNAAPLLDDNGRPRGAVSAFVDITRHREIEERLRQSQKMESIGVLAGGIAHDFNNLLTAVMGNTSMVLDHLPQWDPNRPLLESAVQGARRAADLTRQLLAYSGQGRFVIAEMDLSALVLEMLGLLRASLPATASIRLELQQNGARVKADAGQIQQIITNLMLNACESLNGEPGEIVVRTGVEHVDASFIEQAGVGIAPGVYVRLEVHDTGCGMDAATRERIFEPFFTTKFQGRGLGLSAVHGVVRSHEGAVMVHSHPGKGSVFTVLLPAARGAAKPQQAEAPRRREDLAGEGTILVVDDDAAVRQAARAVLERYGYSVLVAESGHEALRVFTAMPDRFALILLDLTMPGMTGGETLKRLKEIRPDLRVLLSSGYEQIEAIRRFAAESACQFIGKPYSARSLAAKVKSVCAARA